MDSKELDCLNINVKRIKRLEDLVEFGIDPFNLVKNMYDATEGEHKSIETDLCNIRDCAASNDNCGTIRLIHQVLKKPENKFDIELYDKILECKLPDMIDLKISHNLFKIVKRMMALHINECNLLKSNVNHKQIRYIQENQSSCSHNHFPCLMCCRGSILFNTIFSVCRRIYYVQMLSTLDEKFCTYYDCNFNRYGCFDKLYINFFKNKQFEYCPFHMFSKLRSDLLRQKLNQLGYCTNDCSRKQLLDMRCHSMIINHSIYTVKSNLEAAYSNIVCHFFQSMVEIGGECAINYNHIKTFEIGEIILDIATILLKIIIDRSTVDVCPEPKIFVPFVMKQIYQSKTQRLLSLFFKLLVDVNKTYLCKQFGDYRSRIRIIIDEKERANGSHLDNEQEVLLLDCLMGHAIPSQFAKVSECINHADSSLAKILMKKFDPHIEMTMRVLQLATSAGFSYPTLTLQLVHGYGINFYNVKPNNLNFINKKTLILSSTNIDYTTGVSGMPTISRETTAINLEKVLSNVSKLGYTNEPECNGDKWEQREDMMAYVDLWIHCYKHAQMRFDHRFEFLSNKFNQGFMPYDYDIELWDHTLHTESSLFSSFLFYAMFLFQLRSNKAGKYFEYCLKLRPLNGYLNYQYSMYLFHIMKDYRVSYFYLKMAIKLDSNMDDINQSVMQRTGKSLCQQLMKQLYIKLGGKHKCDYDKCSKILTKLNVCRGCRSSFYCSRKCQKLDWKVRHRKKCISKNTSMFEEKKMKEFKQAQLMIKKLLKYHYNQD